MQLATPKLDSRTKSDGSVSEAEEMRARSFQEKCYDVLRQMEPDVKYTRKFFIENAHLNYQLLKPILDVLRENDLVEMYNLGGKKKVFQITGLGVGVRAVLVKDFAALMRLEKKDQPETPIQKIKSVLQENGEQVPLSTNPKEKLQRRGEIELNMDTLKVVFWGSHTVYNITFKSNQAYDKTEERLEDLTKKGLLIKKPFIDEKEKKNGYFITDEGRNALKYYFEIKRLLGMLKENEEELKFALDAN